MSKKYRPSKKLSDKTPFTKKTKTTEPKMMHVHHFRFCVIYVANENVDVVVHHLLVLQR